MFFKWLSYNKLKTRDQNTLQSIDDKEVVSDYFYNREFSFTLANDVYCRYLCFKTAEEFKSSLVTRVPHKIDIGAVFNLIQHTGTVNVFVSKLLKKFRKATFYY